VIDLRLLKDLFPIEGELVRLRVFTEENITDAYLSWLNDPVVVMYSNQRFRQHTQQTSLDYLHTFVGSESILLAVYLKDDEKYVGTMSVYFSSAHETADIGIMIGDKACWGKGVGGDAWSTILSLLLDTVKTRKVTGGTLRCNTGMTKIMVNSGMKPDGVRVEQELVDGQAQDIMHFAKFRGA
jgi:RimJ/RimL family protein N-acetyltransferase